jgi:hypothetical protein
VGAGSWALAVDNSTGCGQLARNGWSRPGNVGGVCEAGGSAVGWADDDGEHAGAGVRADRAAKF